MFITSWDISIRITYRWFPAGNELTFTSWYSLNTVRLFAVLACHLSLGDFLGQGYATLELRLASIVVVSSLDDDRWTTIDEFPPVNFSTLSRGRYERPSSYPFAKLAIHRAPKVILFESSIRHRIIEGSSQDSREFQWNSLEVFRFRGLAVWSIYRIVKV